VALDEAAAEARLEAHMLAPPAGEMRARRQRLPNRE
jgi:hypothetical protein